MKNKIECTLADLCVMTKMDRLEIIEIFLTNWTSTLQSKDAEVFMSKFEDASHLRSSSYNDGLKSAMFNVAKEVMGNMVRSGRAPSLSQAKMCSPVQVRTVADITGQKVPSSIGFIVLTAEFDQKMVDKSIDKYHLRHVGESSAAIAGTKRLTERTLLCPLRHVNIPSDSDSHEKPLRSCRCPCSSSSCKRREKLVSKRLYLISGTESDKSSERWSNYSY